MGKPKGNSAGTKDTVCIQEEAAERRRRFKKLEGAPASALWAAEVGVVSTQPGIHSLVGSVAVTDYFSQDPLFVPVHGLHSSSHLVSRFGHVVP